MPTQLRGRAFGFLLYPDSTPADWLDRLRDLHVPMAISPMHDRDVYPRGFTDENGIEHKAGEIKKPHRHVLICFHGKKSIDQVYQMIQGALGTTAVKHIKFIEDARGNFRYLTHMDDADKAQYKSSEVIIISGFDADGMMAPTKAQTDEIRSEVLSWIRETECINYSDLVFFCKDVEPDWLDYVAQHTVFLSEVIKGQWRKTGATSSPEDGKKAKGKKD